MYKVNEDALNNLLLDAEADLAEIDLETSFNTLADLIGFSEAVNSIHHIIATYYKPTEEDPVPTSETA